MGFPAAFPGVALGVKMIQQTCKTSTFRLTFAEERRGRMSEVGDNTGTLPHRASARRDPS